MKKIIPNTNGLYYATYNGKIYKKDKLVSQHLDRKDNGYFQCAIKINDKYQKQKVHRLIAMAFLGSVENMTVNHIDGNKLNNSANNLEIISHYENMQHAKALKSFKLGRKKSEENRMKLNGNQIKELTKCCETMSLSEMANHFNVGKTTISDYIKRAGIVRKNKKVNQYK